MNFHKLFFISSALLNACPINGMLNQPLVGAKKEKLVNPTYAKIEIALGTSFASNYIPRIGHHIGVKCALKTLMNIDSKLQFDITGVHIESQTPIQLDSIKAILVNAAGPIAGAATGIALSTIVNSASTNTLPLDWQNSVKYSLYYTIASELAEFIPIEVNFNNIYIQTSGYRILQCIKAIRNRNNHAHQQ